MRSTCRACGGQKKIIKKKCHVCKGKGKLLVRKKVVVPVPAGRDRATNSGYTNLMAIYGVMI